MGGGAELVAVAVVGALVWLRFRAYFWLFVFAVIAVRILVATTILQDL